MNNTSNDVISGSVTPYVGTVITKTRSAFLYNNISLLPDGQHREAGTMRWSYNAVSAYGNGSRKLKV
ncbi:MAG: hypothetical protein IPL67_19435 [Ignavibacteria bacterium]|nr:hypothetical protein [Ignavibacteria bacterium]